MQDASINQQVPKVIGVEEVTDTLPLIHAPQVLVLVQGRGEADQRGAGSQDWGQELVLSLLQKWMRQLQHVVSGFQGDEGRGWRRWRRWWRWSRLGHQYWFGRQIDKGYAWL